MVPVSSCWTTRLTGLEGAPWRSRRQPRARLARIAHPGDARTPLAPDDPGAPPRGLGAARRRSPGLRHRHHLGHPGPQRRRRQGRDGIHPRAARGAEPVRQLGRRRRDRVDRLPPGRPRAEATARAGSSTTSRTPVATWRSSPRPPRRRRAHVARSGPSPRTCPRYSGLVELSRANNLQGNSVGNSYLQDASDLMRDTIQPATTALVPQHGRAARRELLLRDVRLHAGRASWWRASPCWRCWWPCRSSCAGDRTAS